MTPADFVPIGAIVVALLLTAALRKRLPPPAATRLVTLVTISSMLTIGGALLLASFDWAISYPEVDDLATWCAVATPGHHPIGTLLGVAAAATLVIGSTRAVVAWIRFWRTDAAWRGTDAVEIIASEEPIAFAVPGKRGTVVVSTGLLSGLPRNQRDALLAHEHAHLRLHHHRYARWTRIATQAIPLLRPLYHWVTLATERWADEEAASVVGDRRVVADALLAAATMQATGHGLLFASVSHLDERVGALLAPPPARPILERTAFVAANGALAASMLSSVVELHHLVAFVHHICTGS